MSSSDYLASIWPTLFPSPVSSEALERIKTTLAMTGWTKETFRLVLDILTEDQSKQGVRLHKGLALWWLAKLTGASDSKEALEYMLEAFVEDILSEGNEAFVNFAATSLREDFGLRAEQLAALKELVVERARVTFYPSALVKEFAGARGEFRVKKDFGGVSEESQEDSAVAQAKENIGSTLRRSINVHPASENGIQDVVSAILFQIDPSTEREKTIGKTAEKESRVDFSMLGGRVGVEVKLIKERAQKGGIVDQINADIASYFPKLRRILFVVYDAGGAIDDPTRFVADIKQGRSEIDIVVIKH